MAKTTIAIDEREHEVMKDELMDLFDVDSMAALQKRLIDYVQDRINEKTKRRIGTTMNQKNYA